MVCVSLSRWWPVAVAAPALAEPMNAEAARHFVAGKHVLLHLLRGLDRFGPHLPRRLGRGRRAHGRERSDALHAPAARHAVREGRRDLLEREGRVLQSLLQPRTRPATSSFRGAISGFGFAYCDFRRGGRAETIQASVAPDIDLPRSRARRSGAAASRSTSRAKQSRKQDGGEQARRGETGRGSDATRHVRAAAGGRAGRDPQLDRAVMRLRSEEACASRFARARPG